MHVWFMFATLSCIALVVAWRNLLAVLEVVKLLVDLYFPGCFGAVDFITLGTDLQNIRSGLIWSEIGGSSRAVVQFCCIEKEITLQEVKRKLSQSAAEMRCVLGPKNPQSHLFIYLTPVLFVCVYFSSLLYS